MKRHKAAQLAAIVVIAALVLIPAFLINAQALQQRRLATVLEYNPETLFDQNNDGIEKASQVIDFTVKDSIFDISINKSYLCTLWSVFNENNATGSTACFGRQLCCSFLSMDANAEGWNDTFFLHIGRYGAGTRNKVSANVIYTDYSFSPGNMHSDVAYGDWETLKAIFTMQSIITFNSTNITMESPDNTTSLPSGEQVYLNFTVTGNASANYSFNNKAFYATPIRSGNSTRFSEKLQGTLERGIIENGNQNITINISANSSLYEISYVLSYAFSVNDTVYPDISVQPALNTSFVSEQGRIQINISTDEYANISYTLNSAGYSNWAGTGNNASLQVNLSVINGSNTLAINATDMNGNNVTVQHTFNFTQNMSMQFNATTDKTRYNASEQILLLVTSPLNSTYNITVSGQNYYQATSFASVGSVTYFFYLSDQGNYTINASFENRLTRSTRAVSIPIEVIKAVKSNLSITLSANSSVVDEGGQVLFNVTVQGNVSSVSYKWDVNGDGIVDYNTSVAVHRYSSNKTYSAVVNVSDGYSNASATSLIEVKRVNNLTIIVVDNSSGAKLDNATVRLDSSEYNTSSNGTIIVGRHTGTYNLDVSAEGYYSYSNDVQVIENKTELISLQRVPSRSVMITLLGSETNGSSLLARFRAVADSKMNCTLQINYSSAWKTADSVPAENNTEASMSARNFSEGSYYFRIACSDTYGMKNATDQKQFAINTSASLLLKTEKIDSLISDIDRASASLRDAEDTKDVFDMMGLNKDMENSRTNLERYKRDLHDLVWRRLNSDEEKNETEKILKDVEKIKNSTPESIKVSSAKEFVVYPKRSSVDEVVGKLLQKSRKKLSDDDRKRFVKENVDLQSKVTVTTKAKHVEITYLSKEKKVFTFVEKELSIADNNSETMLVESIPKDIAAEISQVKVLVDYEVLDPDPAIIISKDLPSFSYYVKKDIELEKIKDASTMLLFKSYNERESGGISGFLVIGKLEDFAKTAKKRLLAEITLIIVLALVYLSYSRGIRLPMPFSGKSSKLTKLISKLIAEAEESARKDDYEASKRLYGDIRIEFAKMPEKDKQELKPRISALCNSINVCFVRHKVSDAKKMIVEGKSKEAMAVYNSIKSVYSTISGDRKKDVYDLCNELVKLLAGAKQAK